MFKINFINHACFQIHLKDYSILVDPWFSGRVFNDSWQLLKETNLDDLDISNLKYILVSHEHPDHLNFETLKKIYNKKKELIFIFPFRKDETVKNVIEKIGLKFHFIRQNEEKFMLDKNNFVKYFSNEFEGDHTMVFSIEDKIIINQNDDYTDDLSIDRINNEFKKIDILFTQFSLAGYYGNSDDPNSIRKNGHDFHLDRIASYQKKFKAPTVVPFASYVYFCKNTNKYLNNFKVTPKEVFELLGSKICQLVNYGDEVYFDQILYHERNKTNLVKLNSLFNFEKADFIESKSISTHDIISMINQKLSDMSLLKKIKAFISGSSLKMPHKALYKFFILSKPLKIKITDSNEIIQIDFLKNFAKLSHDKSVNVDFSIPSEELFYMFKFPWGSDTANITATVNYYSKKSFYFFEYLLKYYHVHGAKFF